ncbi:hypothetical protein [Roseicyclus mahoneyensis]|jgi:hypothetical protein|uniref:Uncharacterized protein n=1 Tax=Roseicyclus mahoneyensis TaxID=164332 RepID=A0A316GKX1_9RHOB|nr:hypothetical protein [Roseicyclus mahoneyensis]PWK61523.1 hypothetical protein C7455_102212 [Roseicyclus mahoneyensis]
MARTALFGGLCVSLTLGSGALAEGWSVIDFNSVATREICMTYAEATFGTYRERFNMPGFTGRSTWTVGGYDLRGEVVDGLFICSDEAGLVSPILVVYNSDDDSDAREVIADRLGDIWDEVVANGGPLSSGGATSGGGTK